jgi:hypothetical protein
MGIGHEQMAKHPCSFGLKIRFCRKLVFRQD